MSDETNKEKDILKDLGEGLSAFGQRVGRKMSEIVDSFSGEDEAGDGKVNVATDVYENRTHYVIEIELPGVQKGDVKISAQDELLTVKGEKGKGAESASYIARGRRFGSFIRSFELPEGLEMENIKAQFTDGVLSIKFPKKNPVQDEKDDLTTIDID
jgi:HSP20 family protein